MCCPSRPIVFSALALLILPISARADTVRVHPGGSIHEAIAAAKCGDTVEVAAGIYAEAIQAANLCTDASRIRVMGLPGPRPIVQAPAGSYAIGFSGAGFVFEHLELTSNPTCALEHRVAFGNGSYVDFVDVLIRDGGYDGLGTYCGARHIRLIDSEVRNNAVGCDSAEGDPINGDGVDLFACRDCEVRGSFIHGNNLYAVQIKGGAKNVVLRDSIFESQSQYGVVLGRPGNGADCPGTTANAEGITVSRNVLLMTKINGWPIEILDVRDATVTHNTITIHDNSSSPGGESGGFFLLGRDQTAGRGTVIRNNIFDNRGLPLIFPICHASYDAMHRITSCTAGYAHAGLVVGNNLYFGGGSTPSDGAATSQVGDPLFTAHPVDLHLEVGSPAIDRGADLGEPFVGAAPDLGAFETMTGPSDGGASDGARNDTGSAVQDAGPVDAGGIENSSGGCGCRAGEAPTAGGVLIALLIVLAAFVSRRSAQT